LAVAAEALAVYEGRFGPYPYTELDVAETAFTVAGAPGGVEFPGIVFISSEFYRPGSPSRDALDVVVAHEVAHQWWYGVVGNHPIDEPWLDEALATYASILYIEAAQGRRAAEEVLWSQAVLPYQFARALGQDGPLNRSSLAYVDDPQAYQAIVYGKGALFLAQLRELLGDADFNAVLRHHYQAHQYGLLQAGDLRESLAAVLQDSATGSSQRPELDRARAEALALYDAAVVRGEPLEGVETLLGNAGRERLEGLQEVLSGDLPPEALQDLNSLFEELLKSSRP
jgi:aminopeptidase N